MLFVPVPPKKLIVLDANGSALQSTVIGPVSEGTSLQLNCVAIGGKSEIPFFNLNLFFKLNSKLQKCNMHAKRS